MYAYGDTPTQKHGCVVQYFIYFSGECIDNLLSHKICTLNTIQLSSIVLFTTQEIHQFPIATLLYGIVPFNQNPYKSSI